MPNLRTPATASTGIRGALQRVLTLAVAGMAAYWTTCARQRHCLTSP